jgi:cytochrome c oxidase cbb3-type subunit 3
MSDFFSIGWGIFISFVAIVGIIWCLYLLFSQRKTKVALKADGTVEDTGHVWDGDLRELNNPLPRWWMWMFVIGCVFSAIYLVLYPGMGAYKGLLGFSTAGALEESLQHANEELKPVYAKYMSMTIPEVAADPQAREMGQRLFLNYCSQCHGSDAGGSKGFPNLTDKDWLYGGDPDTIKTTIVGGRSGVMPPFPQLSSEDIRDVANYVRSLSDLPVNYVKAANGEKIFKSNCAACHGPEAKGNPVLGAPNLSDRTWLYGSSENTIIETVTKGRNGQMPAFGEIISPEKIQLLAAYVWSLTNIKERASADAK